MNIQNLSILIFRESDMKSKRLVIVYFLSSMILSAIFFATIYYYDPLKIFHKPYKYKEYLQENMRQQAAGIINNWDFDSIILGTSMLENTSSGEASEILGGKFVNISLSGSNFWERKLILDYALRKKSIDKVIYSLDYIGAGLVDTSAEMTDNPNYPISSFLYLYDSNPINDFNAYLNDKYLRCIFSFKNKSNCMGHKTSIDRPNAWYEFPVHSVKFGGLHQWFKVKNDPQIKWSFSRIVDSAKRIEKGEIITDKDVDEKIAASRKHLDKTIIRYAEQYPDTEFILVIPPYSRIVDAIDVQYNKPRFMRICAGIRYLVDVSRSIKNIKVYGWGDTDYPDDISHYKDLAHYHYSFNSLMLLSIKNGQGLLTNDNVDKYLNDFAKKSLDYDIISLGRKIEEYLASH